MSTDTLTPAAGTDRIAEIRRDTNETKIRVRVNLDGSGKSVL